MWIWWPHVGNLAHADALRDLWLINTITGTFSDVVGLWYRNRLTWHLFFILIVVVRTSSSSRLHPLWLLGVLRVAAISYRVDFKLSLINRALHHLALTCIFWNQIWIFPNSLALLCLALFAWSDSLIISIAKLIVFRLRLIKIMSAVMGAAIISTLWFMLLFVYNTVILSVIVFHQPIILLVNYTVVLVLLHLASFKTLSYWLSNVEITDFLNFRVLRQPIFIILVTDFDRLFLVVSLVTAVFFEDLG